MMAMTMAQSLTYSCNSYFSNGSKNKEMNTEKQCKVILGRNTRRMSTIIYCCDMKISGSISLPGLQKYV